MITSRLRTLEALAFSGVVELRAFGVRVRNSRFPHSGYYDDLNQLAADAWEIDQRCAESICVTLNEINPDLLARSANTYHVAKTGDTTADAHVTRRHWILLDHDPARVSGISSTDAEHDAALAVGHRVRNGLAGLGIPTLLADSGNGCHNMVRVDLPNDSASLDLVKRFTAAVAFEFDDAVVQTDQGTANAARVVKLYGTMARKGSNLINRPHRRSDLLEVPPNLAPVPVSLLETVAARVPGQGPKISPPTGQTFDVRQWLTDHDLDVDEGPWKGGQKYIFKVCPFDAAHTNRSAYVIEFDNGALAAGCHHQSCAGKGWRDLRSLLDPNTASTPSAVPPVSRSWPAPISDDALIGLAGRFVRLIEPATEADIVALLTQLLCAFGNVIGRSAHWSVEATKHHLNLYVVLVGATSIGRKGTAWDHVRSRLKDIDAKWVKDRIRPGLSTGEGLIWAVRDELESDPGVPDKRLLVMEKEFASPLKVMKREANNLSPVLRTAWDDGGLTTLAKTQPATASDAHISLIGHITAPELTRLLKQTDVLNGFANRFLFVCSRRSKNLPRGGRVDSAALSVLQQELADAVAFGKRADLIERSPTAEFLWDQLYADLNADRPGLLGAMIARGPAQVMRIASIYAVMDRTNTISVEHLRAAAALWRYSVASVTHCFGDSLGDPTADKILRALQATPAGLSRTDIRDLFHHHKAGDDIDRALTMLEDARLAERATQAGGGRPEERWFLLNIV